MSSMYEDDDEYVEERADPFATLLSAAPVRSETGAPQHMEEEEYDDYEEDNANYDEEEEEEYEPEEAGPSTAVLRGKRQKRSRIVMVDGIPVLRSNMYDLTDGEMSVFDSELAPKAFDDPRDEEEYLPRPKVVRKKRSEFEKRPRNLSVEQQRRVAHNNELKSETAVDLERRWNFLSFHREKLRPFLTDKVLNQLDAIQCPEVITPPTIPQPECVVGGEMRSYQLEGLNWLLMMHANGMNPILGDEMGLGKTLQTISFLGTLKYRYGYNGPFLVIVPLSVINSWISEFRKWCPGLRIVRLHSSDMNERERLRKTVLNDVDSFDVVLTTYEMVLSKNMKHTLHSHIHWRYVVLDEAHKCKNEESLISKSVKAITTQRILLLTGTPLQNNLHELWAILQLLYTNVFASSDMFDSAFDLQKSAVNKEMLGAAHFLLQPFMLRRIKSEVEVSMPPKVETKVMCPLAGQQLFWYKRLLLRDMALMANVEGEVMGVDGKAISMKKRTAEDWRRLRNLLMQLRKVCNHPYQLPGAETNPESTDLEDLIEASGKLRMLDRLLMKLKSAGHRVVLFSQFTHTLDLLDDYMRLKGYKFARLDGSTNRVQRMIDVGSFNRPGSDLFIYMLSTRAGGLGLNLQTADTCILYDSDWNPQVDLQAMARVHRIGQTKVVHIYRLVTAGSVEERVVQRAEKKLFLDKMVNWEGSSSSVEWEDLSEGELLATLKFGAQQILKMQSHQTLTDEQLDEHIDNLICRKKKAPEEQIIPALSEIQGQESTEAEGPPAGIMGLSSCEQTAATFEAEMPAMDLRQLMGEDYSDLKHIKSNTSLHEIGHEWNDIKKEKRKRQARLIQVDGHDVLRSNNYDMDTGELSVFGRELDAGAREGLKDKEDKGGAGTSSNNPQNKKRGGAQVAGRDYTHESLCLACQDGGDLLLCDLCPRSWHLECLDGTHCTDPDRPGKWQCPHHRCCVCDKAAAAAGGLLFRCRACPNAYCEDHLPDQHIIIGKCPRLEPLGFRHPPQACYIHCDSHCADFAANWRDAPLEPFVHPNVGLTHPSGVQPSRPQHVPGAVSTVTQLGINGNPLKRKRSRCINERLITNNDYNLSWTDRSQNKVILASASFSGMKDYLVRQLGSKFRLYNGQLLSKIAAMMPGCQTGGEIFWELYILARRLLLRPEERWRLRPEGDMEEDLKKAQRRSELSAAREAEAKAQEQRMEERRQHLEALRQQRREQRRVNIHGDGLPEEWEEEPATVEEKMEMAKELRERMRETAFGYLRLKGSAGATLIQMKAAKLFKHMVNRSKLKGLGVDLPGVLEELMDENKIRCTTEPPVRPPTPPPGEEEEKRRGRKGSSKRVTALSAFVAFEEYFLPDSRLAWLQLAGRTQEEMDFMMDADNILRNQILDFMKSKRTCSRAAVYIAKPVNDVIRRVTYLQRESGIPYALSLLDNVLRELVESGDLLADPPLQPAPPPRIEHSTMFQVVSSGNSPPRKNMKHITSYEVLYPEEEGEEEEEEAKNYYDDDEDEEKEYFEDEEEEGDRLLDNDDEYGDEKLMGAGSSRMGNREADGMYAEPMSQVGVDNDEMMEDDDRDETALNEAGAFGEGGDDGYEFNRGHDNKPAVAKGEQDDAVIKKEEAEVDPLIDDGRDEEQKMKMSVDVVDASGGEFLSTDEESRANVPVKEESVDHQQEDVENGVEDKTSELLA